MTPIEKIKAEIERLKERAQAERVLHPKTILAAKDYLLIQDYDNLLKFITSLQQEQPLLEVKETIVETGGIRGNLEEVPSNVDLEKLEQRILEESRRFPEVSFAKLSRIAKHFYDFGKQAGAKWMAGQGETIETRFTKTKFRGLIAIRSFHKDGEYFKDGEEVIIQIRKKAQE